MKGNCCDSPANRPIGIYAPLWYRGLQEDYLEGAILDLLSPASRMAVIKPPAHDRLLSAIRNITRNLSQANLSTLSFELEDGLTADYWSERVMEERSLITRAEAGEFVERKRRGAALLKELSDKLSAENKAPLLVLFKCQKSERLNLPEFKRRLPKLVAEAAKYGWSVDDYLHEVKGIKM